ncbi:MAG: glycosyltransferase [Chloroflexi bacterium]|nr:glycosyltransferase [Chloroflexota bacterium]
MRLVIVSTYPPSRGSLNEYAYYFVDHLRCKPEVDEVVLLVDELPDGATYPEPPEKVRIIPSWRFGAMDNALRIRQAVIDVDPDAVLFNMQFATFGDKRLPGALGLSGPALVKSAGYPVIALMHNIMETVDLSRAGFGANPVMERITRTAGDIFTRFVLNSDMVAVTIPKYVEILEKKYGAKNVFLAPHGAFQDVPAPTFDDAPQLLRIMTFGKFGTYKKVETLVEAFRILRAQLPDTAMELVIAGTDSPNSAGYLAGVKAQYADVPDIVYTGYVAEEDVPRIFTEATVVVFPYNSTTGSSGVLHQAGNYARPAVLPDLGDFAELIREEGYTGEFFEPENAASLAAAIRRYWEDPEKRRQDSMQNYLSSVGIPMSEVVDWYLLHIEPLLKARAAQQPA